MILAFYGFICLFIAFLVVYRLAKKLSKGLLLLFVFSVKDKLSRNFEAKPVIIGY